RRRGMHGGRRRPPPAAPAARPRSARTPPPARSPPAEAAPLADRPSPHPSSSAPPLPRGRHRPADHSLLHSILVRRVVRNHGDVTEVDVHVIEGKPGALTERTGPDPREHVPGDP